MDRLLSRDAFVALLARTLDVAPETLDADAGQPWAPDPVTLLRVDEVVSRDLGVELPEQVLVVGADVDAIYRAYALGCVAGDLGA